MDGIFGWLGQPQYSPHLLEIMAGAMDRSTPPMTLVGSNFSTASTSRFGHAHVAEGDGLVVAVQGRVRFSDSNLQHGGRAPNPASSILGRWRTEQAGLLNELRGPFALAVLEPAAGRAWLAIDRAGIGRLCFGTTNNHLAFGSSALSVAEHPAIGRSIDLQAIFDYLYFHVIPSPGTLFKGISKLQPGECVSFEKGRCTRSFYWRLQYTPDAQSSFDDFRSRFRDQLKAGVANQLDETPTGAFLSGGTDSSTVVGTFTEAVGKPVDTFSIGFEADGFDEMEYARIAARRFESKTHEYYLKPEDIVSAIPVIAQSYDEPFGNDSAVPTYFCAKLGRENGITAMLAGDGGDEIFGGNARYAKQKIFEAYARIPHMIRHGVIEPFAHVPLLSNHFPVRKLNSYVSQANLRLPDRLETYNFLHRSPLEDIFTPEFLSAIRADSPIIQLRETYDRTWDAHSYLNRMMHVDLKFTLADNDLRKVSTMTEVAGIEVRYPLLDEDLLDFSGTLPDNFKVRGTKLRWFFKEALRDLLPTEIINKSKHGFGLPFGLWSQRHEPLRELVAESLASLARRGWVRASYLEELQRHQRDTHATYYGVMIWVCMILEQWLQAHDTPTSQRTDFL